MNRRRGAIALLLVALAGGARAELLDFSADERARIASHGPWPPPPQGDASNRAQGRPEAVALGRLLFFDARLSADGRVSCASCHQPNLGFQDGRRTALGLGAGSRNTPALPDAALQRWFGWDGAHDSLWAASLRAIVAPAEMGGSAAAVAATVRTDPVLAARYAAVFGAADADGAVLVGVAKALAAWQATLVSPRTAFDDFRDALLRGDLAAAGRYSPAAQRGLKLFIGRGNCSVCHAGPRFSNGEFADIGVPFFIAGGVDAGRYDGIRRLLNSRYNRLGPHNDDPAHDARATGTRHVRLDHRNFGEFKVPGLRQLAATAPYMHDGSLATLADVVRHYSELDEERLHADGERILKPLHLSAAESADLEAFLLSLSAPAGGVQCGGSPSGASGSGAACEATR